MTSPRRGLRLHGLLPAAVLPAAILSLSLIGPAAADEVAYLMYAPGNKGKTEPIRILWDELDQAQCPHHHRCRRAIRALAQADWAGSRAEVRRQAEQAAIRRARSATHGLREDRHHAIVQGIVQASVPPGERRRRRTPT